MGIVNPYTLPVPANGNSPICRLRQVVEPIVSEHMEGFGAALDGSIPKYDENRVRAHQMLRVAGCAYNQAKDVAMAITQRQNPMMPATAFEAPLASSTLVANITAFVTQMMHMSLEVFPRLIAPRLVSVQPFTQPSGYLFYLNRLAKDNGPGGSGAGRQLSTLSTFDKDYSQHANEGDQVRAVGVEISKTLVEVEYRALMHQESHEVDVALRSQYGLDIMQLGDMITAEEMAWEVDRVIVDDVVSYAATNTRGDLLFDETAGGSYAGYSPSEKQAYDRTFVRNVMSKASIEMSADIFKSPNWWIAGTNVAELMSRTPDVYAEKTGDDYWDQAKVSGSIIASGRMRDGSIVLHDPQLDPDTMVCGHVDQMNPFYAGYIFAPFGMASLLTAAFQDPDTLLTKKARALAFAKKGVRPQQFRRIRLGLS